MGRRIAPRAALLAAAVGLSALSQSSAQVFTWNNPSGGTWASSSNWNPAGGPPSTVAHTALFNELATYTVTVNAPVSIGGFDFQAGSVTFAAPAATTFNLGNAAISGGTANFTGALSALTSSLALTGGAILNLSNSTTTFNGMTLISGARITRTAGAFVPASSLQLTLQNGTFSNSGSLDFGGATIGITSGQLTANQLNLGNQLVSGGTLTLTVDGASSVQVGGGATSLWGNGGGDANVTFRNGAAGAFADVTMGTSAGSLVNFSIESGANVSLGNTLVGNGGSATITLSGGSLTLAGASALTIASGGTFNNTGGTFTSGTGSLQITGTGRLTNSATFFANGDVFVSGAQLTNQGTFALAAGRTLSITGGGTASFSTIATHVFNNSTVSISNGGITSTQTLLFGEAGSATLAINAGTAAIFVVSLGSGGGTGTMVLGTSGVATFGSALNVGAAASSAGVVQIDNSASATAANLHIGTIAGSSGTVTVDGAGSRLSFARAVVGSADGPGSALLRLNAGTMSITGASGLNVNPTGRVELNGGTVSALFNPVNVTGGQLVSALNLPQAVLSLTISDNGTAMLSSGGSMSGNGSLVVTGGGDLTVGAGSLTVGVGAGASNARMVVSGAGSTLTAPRLVVGGAAGAGSATFADNALANLTDLDVGVLPGIGTGAASFNVLSGANVNVSNQLFLLSTSGGQITISGPGSAINVLGTAGIGNAANPGTLTVADSGAFNVATLSLPSTGIIHMNGGAVSIGMFSPGSTGSINFSSGTLTLPSTYTLSIAPGGLFGGGFTLNPSRVLVAPQAVHIAPLSVLTIDGGQLRTGTLSGSGLLQFNSGTLIITGAAGLHIGSTAPLGSFVELGPGKTLGATTSLSVQFDGQFVQSGGAVQASQLAIGGLYVYDGGAVSVAGASVGTGGALHVAPNRALNLGGPIDNLGVVQLQPGSRIGGPGTFTNHPFGMLSGDGTVAKPIANFLGGEIRVDSGKTLRFMLGAATSNFGRITLLGGTFDMTGGLTNANTGSIGGRGAVMTAGLVNAGTIALSGGISDVFGPLMNQGGGRTIVTGGATATFFDNVTNVAGSEFRVSTTSTAVFLGAVNGLGAITGSGTTIFEGPASFGALTRSGTTVIEPGGSVSAEHIRETRLIVKGPATITPKATANDPAGTSVVRSLSIDPGGMLDLANNSMIIDYDAPVGTLASNVRQHLQTGRLTSDNAALSTRLGYADNALLNKPTFAGQAIDASSLLVMFTYAGDTDLDGDVDVADLGNLASSWQTSSVWTGGDFDYSGFVDVADLGLLASNWQAGVNAPLTPTDGHPWALADVLSSLGLAGATVPEPGIGTLVAAGTLLALRRRCNM